VYQGCPAEILIETLMSVFGLIRNYDLAVFRVHNTKSA
jgi:hypothetical protein